MPDTTIGFIGLGNMGMPMARRLVESGHTVRGFDANATALEVLASHGGVAGGDVTEVADCADVLILMLPNSDIVEKVLIDEGVAQHVSPEALIVDMSSSVPGRTRALAETLEDKYQVRLIDAPVSGGVKGAVAGTLTIMVGGDDAAVKEAEPVLQILGRMVRTGAVASGHALKALNNLLSATHLLVTSEAMHIGRRFGIDTEVMLDAINGASGRSGSTENKWPNFVVSETYDSGFALQLMLKDMRIAQQLARAVNLSVPLTDRSVELWSAAAQELSPTADHTEIARWSGLR